MFELLKLGVIHRDLLVFQIQQKLQVLSLTLNTLKHVLQISLLSIMPSELAELQRFRHSIGEGLPSIIVFKVYMA